MKVPYARRKVCGRCLAMQCLALAAGLLLAARVVYVQVYRHDEYLARANDQWGDEVATNAERGNLYDRTGLPLAVSVTTWAVGVSPKLVEDRRQLAADLGPVLGLSPQEILFQLKRRRGRYTVLGSDFALTTTQSAQLMMRGQGALTITPNHARIYPTDGVGASLIGFYRPDGQKARTSGLELSLNTLLEGTPGRALKLRTGKVNETLGLVTLTEAVPGQDLRLTIDASLQAICEDRLRTAVTRAGAKGGSVLIMDPANGDVLAAASWPLMSTRSGKHEDQFVWQNRNFSASYEPGSVAKIFTMASLMAHARFDTATVLNCDSASDPALYVKNDKDHDYGELTLMQAFTRSSNVYFAKASANLKEEELHDDLARLGFGRSVGVCFPALAVGSLDPVTQWSKRARQTIAIGQRFSVSAVQMGAALCSVANGGILYRPRLVREIRDHQGKLLELVEPQQLDRVMTPEVAALLREAMSRVVREGTGQAARLDWINLGGKTGTAQKHVEGTPRGYTPGAYVVSFAGLVPVEKPRFVILTLLDEPTAGHRYASQSAAPLFRDVVCDIRRGTDYLTDVPGAALQTVVRANDADLVTVPDVMYLSVSNALERLGARGLLIAGAAKDGQIIEQVPAAGSHCPRLTVVHLTVAEAATAAQPALVACLCPDFSGLSNREVRTLAARLRVPVKVRGTGYVYRQNVVPGKPWRDDGVEVVMRERRP